MDEARTAMMCPHCGACFEVFDTEIEKGAVVECPECAAEVPLFSTASSGGGGIGPRMPS